MSTAPALPPPPEDQRWLGLPRPWVEACLYVLAVVVAAAAGFAGLWSVFEIIEPRPSPWWTLVAAVPASALVIVKYRAPRVSLALALLIFAADLAVVGGIVPLLVVLDALHLVVVRAGAAGRRRVLLGGLVVVAMAAAIAYARSGELRAAILISIQWIALGGLVYWYATAWQQSRELVMLHRQAAEDAAALADRDRVAAVRSERERMAAELHDLVAGHVSAVAIRSEAALSAGDPAAHRAALTAVRDSSLDAHDALRQMIEVLRDGDHGLAAPGRAAVPQLADAARRAGLTVSVSDSIPDDLPAAVDHAVGRIVQESLANAARHSEGATVTVGVTAVDRDVRVDVVSRGARRQPGAALHGSGWGLELIRERVHSLRGELTARPEGDAWAVRARIPLGPAR